MNDIVTPDIKHSAQGSRLLFIDLNAADYSLGGSALAQVFSQIGDQTPEVDLELLQRAIRAVQTLIKQGHVLAGHDRSDGGLLTTVLEMAFAGNCGFDLVLPVDVPAVPYLFNEGLGMVLEVDEGLCAPLMRSLADNQIPAVILGSTRSEHRVTVAFPRSLTRRSDRARRFFWTSRCCRCDKRGSRRATSWRSWRTTASSWRRWVRGDGVTRRTIARACR